jgi:hypothetical protein
VSLQDVTSKLNIHIFHVHCQMHLLISIVFSEHRRIGACVRHIEGVRTPHLLHMTSTFAMGVFVDCRDCYIIFTVRPYSPKIVRNFFSFSRSSPHCNLVHAPASDFQRICVNSMMSTCLTKKVYSSMQTVCEIWGMTRVYNICG